jgi:hypothetical protein
MDAKKEAERRRREQAMIRQAQQEQRSKSYIDDDGCEVTVTPEGHVFFNVADWF